MAAGDQRRTGALAPRFTCGNRACGRKVARVFGPRGVCWRCHRPGFTVTAWGETKRASEWLADPRCGAGVDRETTIRGRLDRGWSPEQAVGRPMDASGRKRRAKADAEDDTRAD